MHQSVGTTVSITTRLVHRPFLEEYCTSVSVVLPYSRGVLDYVDGPNTTYTLLTVIYYEYTNLRVRKGPLHSKENGNVTSAGDCSASELRVDCAKWSWCGWSGSSACLLGPTPPARHTSCCYFLGFLDTLTILRILTPPHRIPSGGLLQVHLQSSWGSFWNDEDCLRLTFGPVTM